MRRHSWNRIGLTEILISLAFVGIVFSVVIPVIYQITGNGGSGSSSSTGTIHHAFVRQKQVMYSRGETNERFYRVFTDSGVFDIRDWWYFDTSSEIYNNVRERRTCQFRTTQGFFHCWKYPCIKEVISCQ